MMSREAAGRLWSQAATFYEEGIQKLMPGMINALIVVETMQKIKLRCGESDKNNIFRK
jgi:hypothetical protein